MSRKNKPLVGVMTREIMRNRIRVKYGNKAIRGIWWKMQVKKYNEKRYSLMRRKTDSKGRRWPQIFEGRKVAGK